MVDQDLVNCPICTLDEEDDDNTLGCYLCAGLLHESDIHRNPWPIHRVPVTLAVEYALLDSEDRLADMEVLLYMRHGGVWPSAPAKKVMWAVSPLDELIAFLARGGVHVEP